jgi:uncharacterized protein (TIGR02996 family)
MAKSKSIEPTAHRVVAASINAHGLSRTARGDLVCAGGFGGRGAQQVSVVDAKTGAVRAAFGAETAVVCWYAEASCDGVVATAFGDCTVRLWDPETGKTRTLAKLDGIVASLAWSADGRLLFTGNCGDNTVRLWDVDRGVVLAEHRTKKSATWFVAMSGDAKRAVCGASDKVVHVLAPMEGRETAALTGHTGKINALAFFPDRTRVVSGSQDKSVRVWDLEASKELAVFGGHTKEVTAVAVSPDGAALASASSDGTIRLWDLATGGAAGVLSLGKTHAQSLTFAADGAELFAGCQDGVLRAFAMARPEPARQQSLAALLALVWAAPDDDGPRAVVADFLAKEGDPRGEFITLQLERSRRATEVFPRERERELLALHQHEWIGPIAPFIESTYVTFDRGFIAGCKLKAVKERRTPKRHTAWSTIQTFIEQEGCPPSLVAHLLALGAKRKPAP